MSKFKNGMYDSVKLLLMTTALFLSSAKAQDQVNPIYGSRVDLGVIEYAQINEASGIAASRKNPGVFWTHNDSGDQNRTIAFNAFGEHLGVYYIDGVIARDWEDMAVGPGPDSGKQYLYIGEIGGNSAQHELKYIYRVPEPDVDYRQSAIDTTLSGTEIITFRYPDGNRDAETVMVDPLTKDIYIVSKWESAVKVYLAAYPQSTTEILTLEHKATLASNWTAGGGFPYVTGGDISPSGLEILIKTYHKILYWQRQPGQEVWEALANEPLQVPYVEEPQGEAISWEPNELGGYYTISEELNGIPAHLYFYPRLDSSSVAQHDLMVGSLPDHLANLPIFATNIEPSIKVRNIGLNDEFGVSITCEIDSAGTLVYSDTQTIDELKRFESVHVTFSQWRTFGEHEYDLILYSQLATDEDNFTDTLKSVVNVSNELDNFESGLGKWISDGWKTHGTAHTGQFSILSSLDRYKNNSDTQAMYKYDLNLANLAYARLTYWSRPFMVPGDSGFVEISTNGGLNWERLSAGETGLQSSWAKQSHSLQSYVGYDSVKFRFRFISDAARTAIGWFIDDIKIEVDSTTTDVLSNRQIRVPLKYELLNNYPNPFNPSTEITYHLPKKSRVVLTIYDMLGRKVKTLVNREYLGGTHSTIWNGTNDDNNPVASGLYFYQLQADEFAQVRKMTLLR